MFPQIFTIGHSDRTLNELVALLSSNHIEHLVDVRTFPASRKFPWFGKSNLEFSIPLNGIEYSWLGENLGGYRKKHPKTCADNAGWRLASFRNYADYALYEDSFIEGLQSLQELAEGCRVAYMCSEAVPWSCHRGIISDYLDMVYHWDVKHIVNRGRLINNKIHDHAVLKNGRIIYPSKG